MKSDSKKIQNDPSYFKELLKKSNSSSKFKTINELLNSIPSPKDVGKYEDHLVSWFIADKILSPFYNSKKNLEVKFNVYRKQQIYNSCFLNKYFPYHRRHETLVAIGNGGQYCPFIKGSHTLGSPKKFIKELKKRAIVVMVNEAYTSQTCAWCNELGLEAVEELHHMAKHFIWQYLDDEDREELEGNKLSNNIPESKIKERNAAAKWKTYQEHHPFASLKVKTRLLACPKCEKRICRDVNGSFKILTNLLDLIFGGRLGISTLKHCKKQSMVPKESTTPPG